MNLVKRLTNNSASGISQKTIARLSLYRRVLYRLMADGEKYVFSHQLALLVNGTAAQVRRDVMAVGYTGSPTRGYSVRELSDSIGHFLDHPDGQKVALVGIGNLGRALLAYFSNRRPKLAIVAAFDSDPVKVNRVIHGCRCYPMNELEEVVKREHITLGMITVPSDEAQTVADSMERSGIRGIVNFAPVKLMMPETVFVEDIDVTTALEKVAYFSMILEANAAKGPDKESPEVLAALWV
jgi:redox-sensing transcriptional repressor